MAARKNLRAWLHQLAPLIILFVAMVFIVILVVTESLYNHVANLANSNYEVSYASIGHTKVDNNEVLTVDSVNVCLVDSATKLKSNQEIEDYVLNKLSIKKPVDYMVAVKNVTSCSEAFVLKDALFLRVDGDIGLREAFDKNIKGVGRDQ